MAFHVPETVSYETLLQFLCCRTASGRTSEEMRYLVELAETLCRLIRERDLQMPKR